MCEWGSKIGQRQSSSNSSRAVGSCGAIVVIAGLGRASGRHGRSTWICLIRLSGPGRSRKSEGEVDTAIQKAPVCPGYPPPYPPPQGGRGQRTPSPLVGEGRVGGRRAEARSVEGPWRGGR